MAAILKSAPKGGGGPTYKALTSRLLISGVPLMEDPGGGGVHGDPLGPWTISRITNSWEVKKHTLDDYLSECQHQSIPFPVQED